VGQRYWDPELETTPWAEVLRWQAARAVPFVRALPERSEFHRSALGRTPLPEYAAGLDFLADLPFTTKDEIRRSQAERRPGQPFGRHQGVPLAAVVQTLSSSGTTGEPVIFALTAADLEVWRDGIAAGFFTAGIRRDDVVAHLVGLPGVAGGLPYADGFRRIGATLAWIGGLPTERIIQVIPRLQATAVLSTTSFGTYLADRCQELTGQYATTLGVRTLLGGGEPGMGQPEIRDKIIRGWGLERACEVMGLGDVMALLWAECEAGGGMHFCGQRSVAVELIDPASGAVLPWEEGVRGEAVYTTFARDATPVLRYRSADHLVVTAMSCPCGRTSPRIRCVGRTDDMLIYKAMNVFPSAIRDVVVRGFPGAVEPYLRIWKDHVGQVRYDSPIPVDVEAAPGLAAGRYGETARAIERELRARLQIRADVTVLDPGTLPRTTYKTPLLHVREPPDGGGTRGALSRLE
jgi:phenylacetate-CoA ligase/benzoylacetate-CoA ligase